MNTEDKTAAIYQVLALCLLGLPGFNLRVFCLAAVMSAGTTLDTIVIGAGNKRRQAGMRDDHLEADKMRIGETTKKTGRAATGQNEGLQAAQHPSSNTNGAIRLWQPGGVTEAAQHPSRPASKCTRDLAPFFGSFQTVGSSHSRVFLLSQTRTDPRPGSLFPRLLPMFEIR